MVCIVGGCQNVCLCLCVGVCRYINREPTDTSNKEESKADSTQRCSQAVPHPSTNRALCRLTSEVRRDPVYSTRYGRQRHRIIMCALSILKMSLMQPFSIALHWHTVQTCTPVHLRCFCVGLAAGSLLLVDAGCCSMSGCFRNVFSNACFHVFVAGAFGHVFIRLLCYVLSLQVFVLQGLVHDCGGLHMRASARCGHGCAAGSTVTHV